MTRALFTGLALVLCVLTESAAGHEVRPAYLEIVEDAPAHYVVLWKQPVMGDMALRLIPHLSGGWLETPPSAADATRSFAITTWEFAIPDVNGLEDQVLSVEGLEATITDVFVRIQLQNGQQIQKVLRPESSSLTLHFGRHDSPSVPVYLALGVEHILMGIDHLMFVLGMVLLVDGRWRLVKTITAFAVAHSLTLGATALGVVRVPPAIVEALVSMSIAFLAVELVHFYRGRAGLGVRRPWVIAFTFGLLHGFAFAGALADIGLPRESILLSLFLFNAGVEIGQLLFIVALLSATWVLCRLPWHIPRWSRWVWPYGIGSFSSYWFVERLFVALAR